MLAPLAAALLFAAPTPIVETEKTDAPTDAAWEFWVGLSGGLRPDTLGGGAVGRIGLDRRVGRYFRPELDLGFGAFGGPGDALVVIRIGTRVFLPREGLQPYLWVAFAHNHEMAFEHMEMNPVPMLLGLSEEGVNHRSGLEAGLGLTYDLPRRAPDRLEGKLGARLTATQMLGVGPPRYVEALVTIGVCF